METKKTEGFSPIEVSSGFTGKRTKSEAMRGPKVEVIKVESASVSKKVRRSGRIALNQSFSRFTNSRTNPIVLDGFEKEVEDDETRVLEPPRKKRLAVVENEDSDGDFVNPPSKPVGNVLVKPMKKIKRMGKMDKHPKFVSKTKKSKAILVKEFVSFSGKKIKPKTSPSHLSKLVVSLDEKQKKTVVDMGFGSVLGFRIDSVPTGLGYWLVKNYDPEAGILNVGDHLIKITEDVVHYIFGIPIGSKEVEEHERSRKKDEVVKEWRGQFEDWTKCASPLLFRQYLVGRKDHGRRFMLNFLVMFFTVMGETTKNNTVNQRFLTSVTKSVDIKGMNWCRYMIRCLNRTTRGWDGEEHFNGPLPLLAAAFALDQKVVKKKLDCRLMPIEMIDTGTLEMVAQKFEANQSKSKNDSDKVCVQSSKKGDKVTNIHEAKIDKSEAVKVVWRKKCLKLPVKNGEKRVVEEPVKKVNQESGDGEGMVGLGKNEPETTKGKGKDLEGGLDGEGSFNYEGFETLDSTELCAPFGDCKDYFYSQEDSQTIKAYVGSDGELRIPMVSQYGDTQVDCVQSEPDNEKLQGQVLDEHFELFEKCWADIKETLAASLSLYPDSQIIKAKETKWNDLLKKITEEGSTEMGCKRQNESDVRDASMMDCSGMDMSASMIAAVEKVFTDGKYDKTPEKQVKVFDIQPLDMASKLSSPVCAKDNVEGQEDGGFNKHERPHRNVILPPALCSPYVKRVVDIKAKLDKSEVLVSSVFFAALGKKWDIVFKTIDGLSVMRVPLESLRPGVCIHVDVISAWAVVLNYEERTRRKGRRSRLFCSPVMLSKDDYEAPEDVRVDHFSSNMAAVINCAGLKKLTDVELVFIPIIHQKHYYVICFNLVSYQINVLDNMLSDLDFEDRYHGWPEKMRDTFGAYLASIGHPSALPLKDVVPESMNLPWQTHYNVTDCGVFLMRHMETYNGKRVKDWRCGLSLECDSKGKVMEKQQRELNDLRHKYLAKILLSEVNTVRDILKNNIDAFKKLREETVKKLDSTSRYRIEARLEGKE